MDGHDGVDKVISAQRSAYQGEEVQTSAGQRREKLELSYCSQLLSKRLSFA